MHTRGGSQGRILTQTQGDLGHSLFNTNSRLDDAHEAPGHRRGNAEEVLSSAASPNQGFYNTKVEEKTTGPSAIARLGNPVAHLSGWCRCGD